MKHKFLKPFLCIVMLLTLVSPIAIHADTGSKTTNFVSNQVKANTNSYITVSDPYMLDLNNEKIVSFTLSFYNEGNTDINFIDYWVRVRTKSGASHTGQLLTSDKEKNRIAGNTYEQFTFYAKVGKTTKISDLIIEVIEWDFDSPNFERVLGKVTIPEGYATGTVSKDIRISNNTISSKVTDFLVSELGDGNEAFVELTLKNTGTRGVTLPGYTYYLKTAEGLLYPLTPTEAAEGEAVTTAVSIQPRMESVLELSTSLPLDIDLSTVSVVVTLSDSEKTVEVPIVILTIPTTFNDDDEIVAAYQLKKIQLGTESTFTRVMEVHESNRVLDVTFRFNNAGKVNNKLNQLEIKLQSQAGVSYPVNMVNLAQIELVPSKAQDIKIKTTIPANQSMDDMYVVLNKVESDKSTTRIASYKLTDNVFIDLGAKPYTNKKGKYDVMVESIQRLPSGEEDVIAANISVTNTSGKTIPRLDLSGHLTLDGIKFEKDKVQTVVLDQILNMSPDSKMNYVVYIKVPYTYSFGKMKVVLQEKLTETSLKTIASFDRDSSSFKIPTVNGKLTLTSVGQKTGVSIKNVRTFEASNTNIYFVQVEVENLEKRPSKYKKLSGYLKTNNDIYFPITAVEEFDNNLIPNGKILVSFWTQLSNKYQMKDFKLILGEEHGEADKKVIVNAYAFNIPSENNEVLDNVGEINLFPYKLIMSNFAGVANVGIKGAGEYEVLKRKVTFNYNLVKEAIFENSQENQKITIELKSGDYVFTKVLELNKDIDMKKDFIEFDIEALGSTNNPQYANNFELNIYEDFKDHKKLLVTKTMSWKTVVAENNIE